MKTKLPKLILISAILLTVQMSFGQLESVPLSNATAGAAHYTTGIRDQPAYNITDSYAYNPNTPTNPYPNCNASNQDNYYLTQKDAAENWFACDLAIPAGKSLKYLDFYGRDDDFVTNSGLLDRWRNLTITLSYGVTTEANDWGGIPDATAADSDPQNHARMDFVAQGFSADMLQNATSIRIDLNTGNHLELMELRLAADTTLGINDLEAPKLTVSPNPLQQGESFRVNLTNTKTNLVQVYSIVGALLYQAKAEQNELSIDYKIFPSSGLYIVKAGISISKIIVK